MRIWGAVLAAMLVACGDPEGWRCSEVDGEIWPGPASCDGRTSCGGLRIMIGRNDVNSPLCQTIGAPAFCDADGNISCMVPLQDEEPQCVDDYQASTDECASLLAQCEAMGATVCYAPVVDGVVGEVTP
jgi:hypothetical protein